MGPRKFEATISCSIARMSQTSTISITGLLLMNAFLGVLQIIPWTSVFILLRQFGLFMYIIKNKETCIRAQKRLQGRSSHITDDKKGYGYSMGYWYLAYIDISNNDGGNLYSMWIIGTEAAYLELTASDEDLQEVESKAAGQAVPVKAPFTILERSGSLFNAWFSRRKLCMPTITPYLSQETIISQIQGHYEANQHTVALICGPPGTGKSMIGILLANHYKSIFCNTLKPWQPGDFLSSLYSEAEPRPDAPLIVAFDEVDNVITAVHAGISPHKSLAIAIPDKSGWNAFFDSVQRGLYPNVIFVLTSNRGVDYIRSIDPAYIREKRVDLVFDMNVTL